MLGSPVTKQEETTAVVDESTEKQATNVFEERVVDAREEVK